MPKKRILFVVTVVLALLLAFFLAYRRWGSRDFLAERESMLSLLPEDASAVVYIDLAQMRSSPFLMQLLRSAPKPPLDNDYARFLQATGFNYESDLDRLAVAVNRQSEGSTAFAVADGRFDRKKIAAYASGYGSLKTASGRTLFSVPLNGPNRKAYFTFLSNDRIAWANDSSYFFQQPREGSRTEWREHFSRLAGAAVFAVLRQDSGVAAALAQVPGGLRSPQLATLLAELQWISIGAKPEENLLRVSVEGECMEENTQHQLKDLLSGLVVLAQMGLNDPKTRKQLDPTVEEGYAELLQSADIQQTDRGKSKSVRVVFDVTPKLLEAAGSSTQGADAATARHQGAQQRIPSQP